MQLSASLGRLYVDALDYDPVKVWSLGASVLAPLFDGERLEAGVAVATAERNQAAYAYRKAALNAFSEVENALSGLDSLARQSRRLEARREVLARSLAIAEDRYHGGYSSYLEALDAQRNLFDTQLAEVQLQDAAEQIDRTLPRPGWRLAGAGACCYRARGVSAGSGRRRPHGRRPPTTVRTVPYTAVQAMRLSRLIVSSIETSQVCPIASSAAPDSHAALLSSTTGLGH